MPALRFSPAFADPARRRGAGVLLLGWVLAGAATGALAQGFSLASQAEPTTLSLRQCIELAIANNKLIRAAYLDRVAQAFDLKVAHDKFTPKMLLSPGWERVQSNTVPAATSLGGTSASTATGATQSAGLATQINQNLSSGARLSLSSSQALARGGGTDPLRTRAWNLSLTQPLLKGAGTEVATASVRLADLTEQSHVLSLKTVISDNLVEVVGAYLSYYKAVKSLAIGHQSVARARDLLTINRTLIAAGRMAEVDLVQSEADVANQEFNLLSIEGTVDASRLALLKALGLDTATPLWPVDQMELEAPAMEAPAALDLAMANRPDYLTAQIASMMAQTRLKVAQNSLLPDLSVVLGGGQNRQSSATPGLSSSMSGWSVGMNLAYPLGDLTLQQSVVQATVDREKAELAVARLRDAIQVDVMNALRNLNMSLRQVTLAQRARQLTEQKFAVESEKLKAGRSSNFQLVVFQNDLVTAQNNELNAGIAYLEAVSSLQSKLGVVLEQWGVTLVQR